MTKEQQDLSWACLPKEARDRIKIAYKSDYVSDRGYQPTRGMEVLQNVFGIHNLTSDTEPEEMLMVERTSIINRYKGILAQQDPKNFGYSAYNQGQKDLLDKLFGDKCLSDKELEHRLEQTSVQVEPKFKVGDKVRIKPNAKDFHNGYENGYAWLPIRDKYVGKVYRIKEIWESTNDYILDSPERVAWADIDLEPYTDSETKDMEEKELNLCELLKGCEGEEFYSRAYGEVTLNEIVHDDRPNSQEIKCYTPDPQSDRIWFLRDGRKHKNGEIDLYPSRALYEKYPLDAKKAWDEWKNGRRPYVLNIILGYTYNDSDTVGVFRTIKGDRFHTQEEVEQAAEAVRECLEKFYKDHQ